MRSNRKNTTSSLLNSLAAEGPDLRACLLPVLCCYPRCMTDDQRFEHFIELCKRIFERMEREGSWPWPWPTEGTEKEPENEEETIY